MIEVCSFLSRFFQSPLYQRLTDSSCSFLSGQHCQTDAFIVDGWLDRELLKGFSSLRQNLLRDRSGRSHPLRSRSPQAPWHVAGMSPARHRRKHFPRMFCSASLIFRSSTSGEMADS